LMQWPMQPRLLGRFSTASAWVVLPLSLMAAVLVWCWVNGLVRRRAWPMSVPAVRFGRDEESGCRVQRFDAEQQEGRNTIARGDVWTGHGIL
jgi:hypothetical protein